MPRCRTLSANENSKAANSVALAWSAPDRSPTSQKMAPRRRWSGVSVKSNVASAPNTAASMAPLRMSRGDASSLAASARRARSTNKPPATRAPAAAPKAIVTPSISANNAPTAAPPEVPSTYGSARGLRKSACIARPDSASSAPTPAAAATRGPRRAWIICRSSPALPSSKDKVATVSAANGKAMNRRGRRPGRSWRIRVVASIPN